jgi:hypothetical protein
LSTSSSEASPPGAASPPVLTDEERKAVGEITSTVTHARNGCLYFAVCNNRQKIGSIEDLIERDLAPKGIAVVGVDLAERDETSGA